MAGVMTTQGTKSIRPLSFPKLSPYKMGHSDGFMQRPYNCPWEAFGYAQLGNARKYLSGYLAGKLMGKKYEINAEWIKELNS
jgi:hypothetical protein